jgi:F-type H+-transporting ATPase subunit b
MFSFLNIAFVLIQAEEQKGGLLDVNPGLVIWTVITFVFLLLILKKLAWKPILGALDQRENFIKDSLEKSEKARNEAEKLLEENKANLAKAEEDAQKVINQARELAEKLKNQILAESKDAAKKVIDEASAEISRKNREAMEMLKGQVAEIAIQAAEKIIKENLDKEKQINIVNRYIDELPKN